MEKEFLLKDLVKEKLREKKQKDRKKANPEKSKSKLKKETLLFGGSILFFTIISFLLIHANANLNWLILLPFASLWLWNADEKCDYAKNS